MSETQHEITDPGEFESVQLDVRQFVDNPYGLREELERHGVFNFAAFPGTGLFPACAPLPGVRSDADYQHAWFRDGSYVLEGAYLAGRLEMARRAGMGILSTWHAQRDKISGVVEGRLDPKDRANRLWVRVRGDTGEPDAQSRVQNDSVGYALRSLSRLIGFRVIAPQREDMELIRGVVRYLGAIDYPKDPDEGHWEEETEVHSSSIGPVIAGLEAAAGMFRVQQFEHVFGIQELIEYGMEGLGRLLPYETRARADVPGSADRDCDAAQLFLVEPLRVVRGESAREIVQAIRTGLRRPNGVSRYRGDTYWGPGFGERMNEAERTAAAPGRLEWRNTQAAMIRAGRQEARWTLFDPDLSIVAGRQYLKTREAGHRERQVEDLGRSVCQLIVIPGEDGRDTWTFPESRYLAGESSGLWVPNANIGLQWSAANLFRAVWMFEQTHAAGR